MLALIIWGAYFGGAQANTNGQNVWKGALVGAASGAAGGYGGAIASSVLGPAFSMGSAIANGAISGVVGGFAGGFTAGAGSSWLNGASFGQGFNSGISTGLSGGVIGGILGGFSGGNQFWDARTKFAAISKNSSIKTDPTGKLDPSNKTLNQFSKEFFPDYKFSNNVENKYIKGYVESINTTYDAFTDPKMVNGRYSIYYSENAFSSKFKLYLVMGHEYIHIGHLLTLGNKYYSPYSEYSAYKWDYRISGNPYYNNKALEYFNPSSLKNGGILKNVINPKYMQVGNFGIYDYIPKGLY